NRQWQSETFVLCSKNEEDEEDAQRINIERGVAGEDALVGQVGPFEGGAFGEFFVGELRYQCFSLTGTEPGRRSAVDFSGRITIVSHSAVRTVRLCDLDQGSERNHLAFCITRFKPGDV